MGESVLHIERPLPQRRSWQPLRLGAERGASWSRLDKACPHVCCVDHIMLAHDLFSILGRS